MKTWLLFFALYSAPSGGASSALAYAPKISELRGILDLQTFPGPPGYESIKDGDDIERHFYLKLDQPFDVLPSKDDEAFTNSEEERGVKVVQLSISEENDKLWNRFRKLGRGAHVSIKGTLFHRFTGHHHSRVLLLVDEMKPITK